MAVTMDLPELRRLAEHAAQGYNAGAAYWPAKCLALLDRIDALEAGLVRLGESRWVEVVSTGESYLTVADTRRGDADAIASLPDSVPVYRLADPGAVAGEPESAPDERDEAAAEPGAAIPRRVLARVGPVTTGDGRRVMHVLIEYAAGSVTEGVAGEPESEETT